ncbi:acetyl-CoA carboxylase carboxyltransferase subunit alpha [Candidatus Hydrogenosomobacter endosymbioticus]|uniref:Acetyl-coenzyme A carboxylase carboxyl transferase subunit alpha n=1 Tax=Candidatus Hydrogenosomobacter endosymbioticus TaxID=2558174 RepID=A0ABN6L349_9PROT|nr:acetyl-CoA carboxylase carboxyltransferase subunit alpha [Candidatus Hydrogenosomobacter endosymbioticus]BDB96334.1 acetyl-coenzyme A carboxylase carboxyl transferase subunit alpha [Candidatus Hydrogenosomobacter endosymbioticus]
MFLDFELPVIELEEKIKGLKAIHGIDDLKIQDEIARLEKKATAMLKSIYSKLSPWQKVLVARHQMRPRASDYISRIFQQFVHLAGDRKFGEDRAIVSGIAKLYGRSVLVIGHEKGSDMNSRIAHNFGMAHPEGYRKVVRLMDLADKFRLPVVSFVDTPGAYAGTGAEERGQFEAIASCIEKSLSVSVPVISIVIGEGGSGGAIALACANYVIMLEHSVYSVISPEGCASILWRTADRKEEAASAQKLTAQDLLHLRVIDCIVPEPLGGAHRNQIAVIDSVSDMIKRKLADMLLVSDVRQHRVERFCRIGKCIDAMGR